MHAAHSRSLRRVRIMLCTSMRPVLVTCERCDVPVKNSNLYAYVDDYLNISVRLSLVAVIICNVDRKRNNNAFFSSIFCTHNHSYAQA